LVLACWHAFKFRGIGCVADFRAANTRGVHYGSRRRDLGVEVEVLTEVGKGWPLNIVRDVVTAQCA
jgi:hypothetical protein